MYNMSLLLKNVMVYISKFKNSTVIISEKKMVHYPSDSNLSYGIHIFYGTKFQYIIIYIDMG